MTQTIALIAALAKNNVIGVNNTLPWRLPADLKHFKQITLGKPIIMGRKTYESIGKPLPERMNIILTQDTSFKAPGCFISHSIEEAIQTAKSAPEIMIIGGAKIYQAFLPKATRLYLTLIDTVIEGDAYFPAWNQAEWQEISRETHEADSTNAYRYTFITLEWIGEMILTNYNDKITDNDDKY